MYPHPPTHGSFLRYIFYGAVEAVNSISPAHVGFFSRIFLLKESPGSKTSKNEYFFKGAQAHFSYTNIFFLCTICNHTAPDAHYSYNYMYIYPPRYVSPWLLSVCCFVFLFVSDEMTNCRYEGWLGIKKNKNHRIKYI